VIADDDDEGLVGLRVDIVDGPEGDRVVVGLGSGPAASDGVVVVPLVRQQLTFSLCAPHRSVQFYEFVKKWARLLLQNILNIGLVEKALASGSGLIA